VVQDQEHLLVLVQYVELLVVIVVFLELQELVVVKVVVDLDNKMQVTEVLVVVKVVMVLGLQKVQEIHLL
tara:strand:- start:233 stop:442 length:210 start_codon:yes stop_codon:yes gene_type:complete